MSSIDEITRAVEDVMKDHIHSGEVVRVLVRRSDEDGDDDMLVIEIIFDAKNKALDPVETSRVARHVWQKLIDMGEDGFPSLSFISKNEAGKLAAA